MFDSNLCNMIIDIGLPAQDCKQYLLVMTPEIKTILLNGLAYNSKLVLNGLTITCVITQILVNQR